MRDNLMTPIEMIEFGKGISVEVIFSKTNREFLGRIGTFESGDPEVLEDKLREIAREDTELSFEFRSLNIPEPIRKRIELLDLDWGYTKTSDWDYEFHVNGPRIDVLDVYDLVRRYGLKRSIRNAEAKQTTREIVTSISEELDYAIKYDTCDAADLLMVAQALLDSYDPKEFLTTDKLLKEKIDTVLTKFYR